MEQLEQMEMTEISRSEQVYEGRKVQAENMRLKKQTMALEKENEQLRNEIEYLKKFIGGKQ